MDMALARHVTHVHQHMTNPALDFTPLNPSFIKLYISLARAIEPHVPEELTSYIVETYVELRADSGGDQQSGQQHSSKARGDQTVITARQLLSILRLCQALARLRFRTQVTSDDVDEAKRLMHMSKASLIDDQHASFAAEDVTR
jgi:DNA replication licensing factor MCM7